MFLTIQLFSQELLFTGKVFDKTTNQILNSVSVLDKTSQRGAITDGSGIFRIKLLPGRHNFEFSYIGFERFDTTINLSENLELFVLLTPSPVAVGEVTISAETLKDQVSSPLMGSFTLSNKEIMKLPSLLGESDPFKFIQLTPGVKAASYGGAGFYVRGGGADQNLIIYDNAIIYNPGHLLGMFSVFNPEIIKDISIIKSGIPAQYGGKLSSVIKLNSYKGNKDSLEIMGSIGLISSRISISGPFFKGKGTFIIGGRQTYLGFIVKPIIRQSVKSTSFLTKDNNYNFYDLNAGASLSISPHDFVTFSAYMGRDIYEMKQTGIKQENNLKWGNNMASLRWNHKISERVNLDTKISLTGYEFKLSGTQADYFFGLFSSVQDYNLKTELSIDKGRNQVTSGFELTDHSFIPNKIKAQAGEFKLNIGQYGAMQALEGGVYINDEFAISPKLILTGGFRFSIFNNHGPYQEIKRNNLGQVTDTINYPREKSLALYSQPEPRLVLKYEVNNSSSIKASYMRIAQYIHLATSASASLPTDIWIPSTAEIKPMIGDQVSIGYFRNFSKYDLEFSSEMYYKKMENQLEFLRGIVNITIDGDMEDNLARGFGQSYGLELYLAKKSGNYSGWLSYTLSRTEQKFDKINEGLFYPAKYDGRHDISLTLIRKFNEKWSGSAVFIYISGAAFTMPVGRYIVQGNVINQYGKVNSFRMPANHRLDVSLTRKITVRKKWNSELSFSIYNIYNRLNPYFIYYEIVGDIEKYSLEVKPFEVTLLPVIPSLSWNFKF